MSYLSRMFTPPATRALPHGEERNLSLTDYGQWVELGLAGQTATGLHVNADNALTYSAVFACIRVLAETLASLPFVLYERQDRGKRRARDHYLHDLLADAPNPEQTAYEFRLDLMGHLNLWGNAYAEIQTNNRGEVIALWPLRPDKVEEITRVNGRLFYYYRKPDHTADWIAGERIWHLRTMGKDGTRGLSPIALHRQGIALGMATEKYGSAFFGNNARPDGVLTHPGKLSKGAAGRLRDSWEAAHRGLDNASRLAILEEGLAYTQISVPPEDAQYLETRTFQKREIATIYRVPAHMVNDLERATFSNIEHMGIEFLSYSMLPWLVNWEQGVKARLLMPSERPRYFAEFMTAALTRGDIETRYEAYSGAIQAGWLSRNDVRSLENLNPVEGLDEYLVPLNMIGIDEPPEEPAARLLFGRDAAPLQLQASDGQRAEPLLETRQLDAATHRQALATEFRPLFHDALSRTVRREVADVKRQARKSLKRAGGLSELLLWLDDFYANHREFMARALTPTYTTYAAAIIRAVQGEIGNDGAVEEVNAFLASYADQYGHRYSQARRLELVGLIEGIEAEEEYLPTIEDRLDTWDEEKPAQEARRETLRSGNAVALLAYAVLGVTIKRWVASGDSCPYCLSLSGAKMSINGYFIPKGGSITAEGVEPLYIDINLGHPPAHDGCDCQIVAD